MASGHLGYYEEAVKCFNKTLEIDPDDEEAWFYKEMYLSNLRRL